MPYVDLLGEKMKNNIEHVFIKKKKEDKMTWLECHYLFFRNVTNIVYFLIMRQDWAMCPSNKKTIGARKAYISH